MNTALRALGWLMVLSGLALAGTRDPDTPDEKYVEFGQKFPFVVRLRAMQTCTNPECPLDEHEFPSSAVLIHEHWVLTAAHVLNGAWDPVIILDDKREFPLTHFVVHKDFDEGDYGHHDIAIGYSPKGFGQEFYPALYKERDEITKVITFSGFGLTGNFNTGCEEQTSESIIRRAGQNKIDTTSPFALFCNPSTGGGKLPLEFMVAPGDSGGGMFIGNKLAGINSHLVNTDHKSERAPTGIYGDESAFTRVSSYADWVESQIQRHELQVLGRLTTGSEVKDDAAK